MAEMKVTDPAGRSNPDRRMIWYLFIPGFFAIFSATISKTPVLHLFSQAIAGDNTVIGLITAFSPLTGIIIMLTSYSAGFFASFILARGVTFVFMLLFRDRPPWISASGS